MLSLGFLLQAMGGQYLCSKTWPLVVPPQSGRVPRTQPPWMMAEAWDQVPNRGGWSGGGNTQWFLKLRQGFDEGNLGRDNPIGPHGVHYAMSGSREWSWPPAQLMSRSLAVPKLQGNPWSSGLSPRPEKASRAGL